MRIAFVRVWLLPLLLFAMGFPGCSGQKKPAPDEGDLTAAEVLGIRRFGANPNPPVLVAEGSPPLVHLFDAGGRIRIVDTTVKRVIATATAPPRSIIAIDEEAGIRVAGVRLVPGPLPAGRHFQVWWETRPAASQPAAPD